MLFGSKSSRVRVLCSSMFPSGRKLGAAFLRGIPNATKCEDIACNSLISFVTPDIHNIFQNLRNSSKTWFYADHAYFGRHKYFRITRESYQHLSEGNSNGRRFNALDIELKPWRSGGNFILICPQSDAFMTRYGFSRDGWIQQVTTELREYTDREIRVHDKATGNSELEFAAAVKGAHAVVVFTSVAGVQAVMHGVPCFTTQVCSATALGRLGLKLIEYPYFPEDRVERFSVLADNQWTLTEIRSGKAWRDLQNGKA